MRERETKERRGFHYYCGRSSYSPARAYGAIPPPAENYVVPEYEITSAVSYCKDELHTKVLKFPYTEPSWDVGDCSIFRARDVDCSAIYIAPVRSYWEVYSGRCEFQCRYLDLLSSLQPEQSDYELLQRAQPAQESMSIPNFLYELRDLKETVMTVKNFGSFLRKAYSELSNRAFRKAGKAILRESASQHLNTQFGVIPTVSDLLKIADQFINFDNEIKRLKAEAGKLLTRRASCKSTVDWDNSFLYLNYGRLSLVPDLNKSDIQARIESSRRVVGKFSYELPKSSHFGIGIKELDTELKRRLLGLRNLSLGDIWQAIPWSWLVDWVFNTQAALGRDTIVPVTCHEACFIDEVEVTFNKFDIHFRAPLSSSKNTTVSIGDQNAAKPTFTMYRRTYRDPTDTSLQLEALRLKGVNAKQLSLLAAIGVSSRSTR